MRSFFMGCVTIRILLDVDLGTALLASYFDAVGGTVWLECYAGKFFLPKLHTPTHISLESLYKAGHNEIVNGAIKHL